jgi:hypothetical protein
MPTRRTDGDGVGVGRARATAPACGTWWRWGRPGRRKSPGGGSRRPGPTRSGPGNRAGPRGGRRCWGRSGTDDCVRQPAYGCACWRWGRSGMGGCTRQPACGCTCRHQKAAAASEISGRRVACEWGSAGVVYSPTSDDLAFLTAHGKKPSKIP